ncbi:MAG: Acyl-CoA dehydrogenase domain protein [Solirubrobacterales bacterium]|nr:Acyl-CoA dehydrogenase domain protein [Solirubrobacterales bacterium]
MLTAMPHRSRWMTDELEMYRESLRGFFAKESTPNQERWGEQQHLDRDFWNKAGELGILCASIPEEYGGGGGTFAHEVVALEEQAYALDSSFGNAVHSTIVAHYVLGYGSEELKQEWLPRMASGEVVGAIAMTEPGTGSDLQAISTRAERDGDEYVLNGAKTFITNGLQCDMVIVAAKTDPNAGAAGVSLFCVDCSAPGFSRGRVLHKVGMHGQDTAELFFEDVRLPASALLGEAEGQGFIQLMMQLPQERLTIGVAGVATMERMLGLTIEYTKERKAFGRELLKFQNTRFKLAEAKTDTHVARVFLDDCITRHLDGQLDAITASMAKYWISDRQVAMIDECLQLFGGYGYMTEYPIARAYADSRIQKIYGGTNEIMKELIARSL